MPSGTRVAQQWVMPIPALLIVVLIVITILIIAPRLVAPWPNVAYAFLLVVLCYLLLLWTGMLGRLH